MTTVLNAFRINRDTPVEGDVGVEIEVEGARLPTAVRGWNVTHDGSLREHHGMALEYVFRAPATLKHAEKLLDNLKDSLEDSKSKVADSPRCGVHVHVNVQGLTITQLYNFFALYFIFEGVLTKFCGKQREGNLFCLRAKDAEFLVYELERALEDGRFRNRFSNDQLRYAAMNVCSLPRYGSLEFRSMRGTTDKETVMLWTKLLVALREQAKQFEAPYQILEQVSMGGEAAILLNTFGEDGRFLMEYEGWEQSIMEGVRRCQVFSYSGDWESLNQVPKRRVGGVEVPMDFSDDFPPMDM